MTTFARLFSARLGLPRALFCMSLVAAVGCGGDDDSSGAPDAGDRDGGKNGLDGSTSGADASTDAASDAGDVLAPVSASLGPEGGTLKAPDGRFELHIPEGALDETTTFTLRMLPEAEWPESFDGEAPLAGVYDLQPDGFTFDEPVFAIHTFDARPSALGDADDSLPFVEHRMVSADGTEEEAPTTVLYREDGSVVVAAEIEHLSAHASFVLPHLLEVSGEADGASAFDTSVTVTQPEPPTPFDAVVQVFLFEDAGATLEGAATTPATTPATPDAVLSAITSESPEAGLQCTHEDVTQTSDTFRVELGGESVRVVAGAQLTRRGDRARVRKRAMAERRLRRGSKPSPRSIATAGSPERPVPIVEKAGELETPFTAEGDLALFVPSSVANNASSFAPIHVHNLTTDTSTSNAFGMPSYDGVAYRNGNGHTVLHMVGPENHFYMGFNATDFGATSLGTAGNFTSIALGPTTAGTPSHVMLVRNDSPQVLVLNADGTTLGSVPPAAFTGGAWPESPVSGAFGPDPDNVLFVLEDGQVVFGPWTPSANQTALSVSIVDAGDPEDDPRFLRCFAHSSDLSVCALARFGSDEVAIFEVTETTATLIAEVAVGDGPVDVGVIAENASALLIAVPGFNDDSFTLLRYTTSNNEVATVGSRVTLEECVQPGHAIFTTPTDVLVSCFGSAKLLRFDPLALVE